MFATQLIKSIFNDIFYLYDGGSIETSKDQNKQSENADMFFVNKVDVFAGVFNLSLYEHRVE